MIQNGGVIERAELVEEDFEINLLLRQDFRFGGSGLCQLLYEAVDNAVDEAVSLTA